MFGHGVFTRRSGWLRHHGGKARWGNGALALLCNTLPTGAILTVLILTLGPISGAHFNPAVSTAMALRGDLAARSTAIYIAAQVVPSTALVR